MRALKLVQHMKQNADGMSEGLLRRIRESDKCRELSRLVQADEHKRYASGIYRDLTNWLSAETSSVIEQHFVTLGERRAQQRVPFSDVFWAACIARDYLWDYMQQECLIEEPVEFWGGVNLLYSLNKFFDRVLYLTLIGYQKVGKGELAALPA